MFLCFSLVFCLSFSPLLFRFSILLFCRFSYVTCCGRGRAKRGPKTTLPREARTCMSFWISSRYLFLSLARDRLQELSSEPHFEVYLHSLMNLEFFPQDCLPMASGGHCGYLFLFVLLLSLSLSLSLYIPTVLSVPLPIQVYRCVCSGIDHQIHENRTSSLSWGPRVLLFYLWMPFGCFVGRFWPKSYPGVYFFVVLGTKNDE